jgi:hypothetical protein
VKPCAGSDASGTEKAPRLGRGVREFVALHLAAVGILYALAVTLGGGFVGTPMPPITGAMAAPSPLSAALAPAPARPTTQPLAPATLPDWTRRAEIIAPWESR